MHATITCHRPSDWYIAHVLIYATGRRSIGYGTTHYKALLDAINDKSKY